MSKTFARLSVAVALVLATLPAQAKPIAFRGGTSAMYEWGAGTIC